MSIVTKTRTYTTGDTLSASNYNADRDEIIAGINSIVNAQIAVGAAIEYAKLNLTGSIVNADISGSAAIAYSKLNLTSSIVEADLSLSDNTTANVSTSKHGFVPKAPNDTTKFLRGDGAWAVPTVSAVAGTLQSFQQSSNIVNSFANSTTFVEACSVTFTPSAVCDIDVIGTLNWYASNNNDQGKMRITLDGTPIGSDPDGYADFPTTLKAYSSSAREFATNVSAASHKIAVEYGRNSGAGNINLNLAMIRIAVYNH